MRKRELIYKTEVDLCAAFNVWASARGWTPYAETEGWDILLVHPEGWQIGVQAKMRFNLEVIAQTIGHWHAMSDGVGPDFRAILVPGKQAYADLIGGALGVGVFEPNGWKTDEFVPGVLDGQVWTQWHYWNPVKRHRLPEFVPDVPAGAASPVQLTSWKVAALRISAVLELRGYVTREDFRRYHIDPRRWHGPGGWLLPMPERSGCYVASKTLNFKGQHPVVYPQVLEEVRAELERVERLPEPAVLDLG
jgi:hypothetical protein